MNNHTQTPVERITSGKSKSRSTLGLATAEKTFFGYPISWFEKCKSYLDADGVVNKDGTFGLPDHGGFIMCFRMKDEKRKIAKWGG